MHFFLSPPRAFHILRHNFVQPAETAFLPDRLFCDIKFSATFSIHFSINFLNTTNVFFFIFNFFFDFLCNF